MNWLAKRDTSTTTASLIGIAIGLGVIALYLVAGLVLARWNVTEFSTNLSLESVGTFLLMGVLTVATFAIPVTAYFRLGLRAPVAFLAIVMLGWVGYAAATGLLLSESVFGLGLYVVGLSPVYFVCYAIFGGVEYYARNRTAA